MRIVFLGSGPFAVPSLERLHRLSGTYPLARVVTRPDRPAGRGGRLRPTPVRRRASELGVPCDAPATTADPAYLDELRELDASLFIVADYGEILRSGLRAVPTIGIFNLHASLLPKYRGAAPIQYALLAGEERTGVTLFRVERELDSGPIVDMESLDIRPLESAGELEERLSILAADLLERNLAAFADGTFTETAQDHELATRAPKIEKAAGLIDWSADAERVSNTVRAYNPSPRAFSFLHRRGRAPERTTFTAVRPADAPGEATGSEPGSIGVVEKKRLFVLCGRGAVEVEKLQRPGKSEMAAAAYLQGKRLAEGDRFGPLEEST